MKFLRRYFTTPLSIPSTCKPNRNEFSVFGSYTSRIGSVNRRPLQFSDAISFRLFKSSPRDAIDKEFSCQACFIDFKKVFDSLGDSQLNNKIYNYFRGPIIHIMSDYLTNRWQDVFDIERINEKTSCYQLCTSRFLLPQGPSFF